MNAAVNVREIAKRIFFIHSPSADIKILLKTEDLMGRA